MVKDTKYIIKRIIIGVGIALILMLIKGGLVMDVQAEQATTTFSGTYDVYTQEGNIPNALPYGQSAELFQYDNFPDYTDNVLLLAEGNRVWYAFKTIFIKNTTYQFKNGVAYTISLDFQFLYIDNYQNALNDVERSHVLYSTYADDSYTCTNASCSVTYTKQNGYYNVKITFIPSANFTGTTIQLGSFTAGKLLFVNKSPRNLVVNIRRATISNFNDSSAGDIINNATQNTQNIINNQNSNTQSIINNNNANTQLILDDNTDNSEQLAQHNFSNFQLETHGLTAVVTAPLRFFQSFLNSTCTPLRFPLPFVNNEVVLPCLSPIYQQYFPTFLLLYRLITDGVIGYWVCIKIFQKMKGFLDPQDDKVEVFDL